MPVSAQDASAATTGPTEYRSKAPPLEAHKTGQLEKEEQSGLRARHKAAEEADRRVWATDAQLLDAKQKTDFYRTKMQEIVSGDGRGGEGRGGRGGGGGRLGYKWGAVWECGSQVLFKTKCDNRLNEIAERADAEQREVKFPPPFRPIAPPISLRCCGVRQ